MATETKELFETIQENGDPKVSIRNLFKLIRMHGVIIGVIHRISPYGEHSTLIFFEDNFIHEFIGLKCGKITKENFLSICGLKEVLFKIPFLGPHIAEFNDGEVPSGYISITNMGNSKDLEKHKKDFITLNYIIRPPSECPESIRNCDGSLTLDQCIYYLSQDPHSFVEEF